MLAKAAMCLDADDSRMYCSDLSKMSASFVGSRQAPPWMKLE